MASELLPEPLGPQQTVIWLRGISTSMPLRLCCRAPRTSMAVNSSCRSRGMRAAVPALHAALPLPARRPAARGTVRRDSTLRNARPVWLASTSATSSGGPVATIRPPPAPPSGPRSMIQSAVLITSRLCSTTTTVLPGATKPCSTFEQLANVGEMQAGRRLVEDDRASCRCPS